MTVTTFAENTPAKSYIVIRDEFTNRILASNIKNFKANSDDSLSYYDNFPSKKLACDYTVYSDEFAEYAKKSNALFYGVSDLIIEFINESTKEITHVLELKQVHLVQVECPNFGYIGTVKEELKTSISAQYSHLMIKKEL